MIQLNKFTHDIYDINDVTQQWELYKLQVAATIYIDGTKLTNKNKIEEIAELRMLSWKHANTKRIYGKASFRNI